MRKAYIAIDLGAESGRVIVGVLENDHLTLHELHRFMHLPVRLPSGLHWNLPGLWEQIIEGLRKCAAWARENDVTLTSLGVDTWGVDWSLIGREGELLGLPHAYRDERHAAAYEKVLAKLGRERIYAETGIQFMPLNTLYQVAARHEAEPALLENAQHLLFIPDLLHYFFTGVAKVEFSIASTSQMLNPQNGRWAIKMLEDLNLPTRMLGAVVPPSTTIGTILPHIAQETSLPPELKVIAPATHDTASAVAAVPAAGEDRWCYLSSGTWSLMGAELRQPCLSDAAREVPFTNEGGVDGTIRFLRNIAGLWLVQETRRHYEKLGEHYDYATLTRLAGDAEPFRTLVDTEYAPFGAAGDMPLKIGEFARSTRQPEPATPGQVVRCCLESLALTYRYTLNRLEEVLATKFDVLHIVGGGGRNTLLNQMTADAIGRPVVVGPHEATAAGNVLVQAMGAGDVKDLAHIRRIVTTSFEPETYQPQDTAAWDRAYARFTSLRGSTNVNGA